MTLASSPAAVADDIDHTIGFNVHSILYRRHLNQKPLASRMGVTPSVLSKKLRGTSAWSAKQVAVAAAYLDVEPGRLYEQVTVSSLRRNREDRPLRAIPGQGRSSGATQPGLTQIVPCRPIRPGNNSRHVSD